MKNTRKRKLAINSTVIIIGAVIVTVLLNMLLISFDEKIPLEINLTRDKIYELTDETIEIVDKIKEETQILLLYESNTVVQEDLNLLTDIIGKYQKRNNKISLKTVDFVKGITELTPYLADLSQIDPRYAMIFVQGERYEIAESSSYLSQSGKSLIERVITNNLANFVDGHRISSVLMTMGHGEKRNELLDAALDVYGYQVKSIDLLKEDIPDDGKYMLVVNAPSGDFSTDEIEKVDRFLDKGGNVQIYFNPMLSNEELPRLESYLKEEWAIERGHEVVVDMDNRLDTTQNNDVYGSISVAKLTDSELVKPIASSKRSVIYSLSNPLSIASDKPQAVEITPVLTTENNAYLKALENMNESKSSGDTDGTFNVLLSASRKNATAKEEVFTGKLIVSGSSYTLDTLVADTRFANEDLLMNSINWMRGSNAGVTVREKDLPQGSLTVPNASFWPWFIALVVVIPVGVLISGIVIWMKRRFK